MKKLEKSLSKYYMPLILRANDFDDINSILIGHGDVEIIADDVKYDDLKEFLEENKTQKPSNVLITGRNPYLTLEISPNHCRLYISSDNLLATGIFTKIDSILTHCERKPKILYQQSSNLIFIILLLAIQYTSKSFNIIPKQYEVYSFIIFHTFMLIYLSWLSYISFINIYRHSLIYTITDKGQPGFIKRNFDYFIVSLISLLVGGVLMRYIDKLL